MTFLDSMLDVDFLIVRSFRSDLKEVLFNRSTGSDGLMDG